MRIERLLILIMAWLIASTVIWGIVMVISVVTSMLKS